MMKLDLQDFDILVQKLGDGVYKPLAVGNKIEALANAPNEQGMETFLTDSLCDNLRNHRPFKIIEKDYMEGGLDKTGIIVLDSGNGQEHWAVIGFQAASILFSRIRFVL